VFDWIDIVTNSLRKFVTGFEPGRFSGDQAATLVRKLAEVERLAAAGKALAAARVDESNRWRRDGHRSAAHWMAAQTGSSVRGAIEAIDTAKRVTKLPHVEDAFRTGQLSAAQAGEISAAAEVSPQSEHDLLNAAKTDTLSGLREKCRRTRHAALPNETARNEAIRQSRYFRHRTTPDGAFEASLRGTTADGARLLAALEPFRKQVFEAARRAGTREPFEAHTHDALIAMAESRTPPPPTPSPDPAPTPPTSRPGPATTTPTTTPTTGDPGAHQVPPPVPTSTAQPVASPSARPHTGSSTSVARPAEPLTSTDPTSGAAATLFSEPVDHQRTNGDHLTGRTPDPSNRPAPPRHTDADPPDPPPSPPARAAIADGPRAMIHVRVDHSALRRGHTIDGEICEIPGIGPIPVATATMLAADSIINVLLVDGVDVTRIAHTGRTVNAHQRSALRERSSTCEVPGCDTRDNLEIDHNEPWALSKNTSLDNLNLLCPWHHYQKTHCGYRLTGPPGNRQWHPPGNPN
jgi:hypothetical protein